MHKLPIIILLLILQVSCAHNDKLVIEEKRYADLKNWPSDNHEKALEIYVKSCSKFHKKDWNNFLRIINISGKDFTKSDLQCDIARDYIDKPSKAREFFEKYFTPFLIKNNQKESGLFTGYYELELKGSLTKHGKFIHPIYAKPDDLKPKQKYYSRKEIEAGKLEGRGLEIAYTDDPVRLFFLHIQGSGAIRLEDGRVLQITYDGQNGHKYYSVGRYLRHIEKIDKEKLNAEFIINYLTQYEFKAKQILDYNNSYVFFKINPKKSPIGAAGIELTDERSLAIDRKFLPLGSLLWLETNYPDRDYSKFNKLMIAQDTGGAIKGPVRGDIYFGSGDRAEKYAYHMKNKGKYYMLLPTAIIATKR